MIQKRHFLTDRQKKLRVKQSTHLLQKIQGNSYGDIVWSDEKLFLPSKAIIEKECERIPQKVLRASVKDVNQRLKATIEKNGGHLE